MLTDEIKTYLQRSVLCWLATISEDGTPNVSPREIFVPEGDKYVLIAHVASPKSVRNIKANPKVGLSFVEVFEQRGFKLNGTAQVIEPSDPHYDERVQPLKRIATERFPVQSFIEVEVLKVAKILAPRYCLYPETTAEGQIERAVKTYNRVLEQHKQKLSV
ncbi:MAG: pyridoxamine 5'-phosphate oxidase family protein [Trueperaceae bacterium]